MYKLTSIIFCLIIICENSISQKIFISPFFGTNITVASNDNGLKSANTPNKDFNFVYPRMNYSFLQPFTFGVLFEYQWKKNRVGTGIIFSDATGSSFISGITVASPNSDLTNNLTYALHSTWIARTATKLPFNYSYNLISAHHIGKTKNFFDIRLRVGFNLLMMRKWDEKSFDYMEPFNEDGQHGFMIQPSEKIYTTLDGNTAGIVTWECNLQKGFSFSFNAGFEIDLYLKNRRRITASFYYEQGTRNVSAIVNQIYYNGVLQGYNAVYSRGSAIQFKLGFPIEVLKKYTARFSEN